MLKAKKLWAVSRLFPGLATSRSRPGPQAVADQNGRVGKHGIGVIGAGNISSIYLSNLQAFPQTRVVALADLDLSKARSKADEHGVAEVLTVEELLRRDDVVAVVNLTVPATHSSVGRRVLEAGKHLYNEKPFATTREDSAALLELARSKGLLVACAPDTVLGAGIQTVRELVDSGAIGQPLHAQAWMMGSGVEKWHPNPEFFFKPGGGPLLDMGPYYLSALVTLLGPVKSVMATHRINVPRRTIESQPLAGQVITVETPTHICLVASFVDGPVAQFTASFDTFAWPEYPCIDIFGTEGMIRVPDPNSFHGPVRLRKEGDWEELPLTRPYQENSRGVGVLDMVLAAENNRPVRASGELAAHVLDVMLGALESGDTGRSVEVTVTCSRPAPMPTGLLED